MNHLHISASLQKLKNNNFVRSKRLENSGCWSLVDLFGVVLEKFGLLCFGAEK